jgi:hypothetical protein
MLILKIVWNKEVHRVKKFWVFFKGSKEDILKYYLRLIFRTLMYYFYIASIVYNSSVFKYMACVYDSQLI